MSRLCLILLLFLFSYTHGFGCDEIIREGEYCALSRGLFNNRFLPVGYNKITTIPASACNMTFLQMRPTLNNFAIRTTDGKYVFNGVSYKEGALHSIQTDVGIFTYLRNSDGERLSIPGPIKEPMELMLHTRQENLGITYEYYHSENVDPLSGQKGQNIPAPASTHEQDMYQEPHHHLRHQHHYYLPYSTINYAHERPQEEIEKNSKKTSRYDWVKTGYSECSKTCAGGIQEAIFACKRLDRDMIVPDKRCSGSNKPETVARPCNNRPCLPVWTTSDWGVCSVTCGDGLQKREIQCKQQINSHTNIIVTPAACAYVERPRATQTCSSKPCETLGIWTTSPWSECSNKCGPGVRTRTVACSSPNCEAEDKPVNSTPCEGQLCHNNQSSPSWVFSEWSNECTGLCGEGIEERRIVCHGEGECDKYSEPARSRKCEAHQEICSGQWFTGPWGKCTGKCEWGERRRGVICVSITKGETEVVPDGKCNKADKPVNREYCELPACQVDWFTSEWGECTQGCNGVQERKVVCLDEKNHESAKCYKSPQPPTSQSCEMDSCNHLQAGNITVSHNRYGCSDKQKNCRIAAQARMCAYEFYKLNCCYSCSRKRRYLLN
ncbi:hypothetical protein GE061_000518 [Apolygus lucorum]|uniref:Uncharacterized protein n=1 Tax=Apolygus lucorum TaxID=248454 RepID=A0A6A4K0C8_APOLU|nr:hypothetical protein GE061_000518 [Apolygus lucorum]